MAAGHWLFSCLRASRHTNHLLPYRYECRVIGKRNLTNPDTPHATQCGWDFPRFWNKLKLERSGSGVGVGSGDRAYHQPNHRWDSLSFSSRRSETLMLPKSRTPPVAKSVKERGRPHILTKRRLEMCNSIHLYIPHRERSKPGQCRQAATMTILPGAR